MADTLDIDKFNELKTIMGDAFATLIDTFKDDTQNNLANLRNSHSENNISEVHRLAHSLKSTSANLGAIKLSEVAKQLELEAKQDDLSNAEAHIGELETLYKTVCEEIQQLTA